MSYPEFTVTWYQKISKPGFSAEWSSTGVNITDIIKISIDEAISDGKRIKSDVFELKFMASDSNGDGFGDNSPDFGVDDIIEIRFSRDGGSSILLMSGKVTKYRQEIQPTGRIITLEGINRTEGLLKSLSALKLEEKKTPMLVAAILAEVNEDNIRSGNNNKLNYVYYNEDTSQYEDQDGNSASSADITIQRYKNDGSSEFPTISSFTGWYNSAYEQIQKVSSWGLTEDGNYIFYVDSSNNFYWKGKPTTISATIVEGTDFVKLRARRDNDKIVNFFIIHCGEGPRNSGILTFASNDESIAEHSLSASFLDRTYLADTIMREEKKSNPSSFDDDSYPFPTNAALVGGYTFSFQPRQQFVIDGTVYNVGLNITVYNKQDYNEVIIKEAQGRGETEALNLLDVLGESSWYLDIELNGTATHSKGSLIRLDIPSISWTGSEKKELRIHEINQTFDKNGWSTTLSLQEDEESV